MMPKGLPYYVITTWDAMYMIEHKAFYTQLLASGLGLER